MKRVNYAFLVVLSLFFLVVITAESGPTYLTDPAYTLEPWTRLWGPPGGLGYDVRMRPDNPDIMYVTASPGGIFKSTDGGKSWFSVTAGIEPSPGHGANIFCATIDPHDYNTVWVGTQFIAHVYRSPDGGEIWEQRDNGITPVSDEHSVRGITVDPSSPNVVYAGLEATTNDRSSGQVYKSTDAGLNWTLVWEGDNLARYVWVDPRNTQRVYVSTGIFDRTPANFQSPEDPGGVGILRSDDGGETWDTLDQTNGLYGLSIPSLFMHPKDPNVLFAAATKEMCALGTGGGYVTRDGGTTWEKIFPESFGEAVEIAASDPDVWYLSDGQFTARSDDAGKNWKLFRMGVATKVAGIPIDLQVDPRDPYRIFVNNYGGGNLLSTDGGETWADASKGYSGAQVQALAIDASGRAVYASVMRGDTYRSADGGEVWEDTRFSVSYEMAFQERSTTDILVAGLQANGNIYRSTDGGVTWDSTLVVELRSDQYMMHSLALARAPSDPQIVYIGYGNGSCAEGDYQGCTGHLEPGLFRSSDGGKTWEHVEDTPFKDYSIISIAVSLDDPLTVFVATGMGPFVSRNGGDTWQFLVSLDDLAGGSPPRPGAWAPSVYVMAIDPFDPQVIYAGGAMAAVFRSSDRGQTWGQAAAGMDPNAQVRDLVADPNRPGVLYAGLRYAGVFVSTDWAETWRGINQGLDRTEVQCLALSADGTVLYAGTNGVGLFRLGIPRQKVEIDIKPRSCPNPLDTEGRGVLPVAILGTEDFDVTAVDRASILLEGVPSMRTRMEDVAAPVDDRQDCGCTEEEPDGYADLTLKFDKEGIVAALGEVNPGEQVVLTLTGKLTDGTPIAGADCVVIVPVRAGQQSGAVASSGPKVFGLSQNQPNPFSRSTVIDYQLPVPAKATLRVYDVAGRVVRTLTDALQKAGYYSIAWDGKDEEGTEASAGIYFYSLQAYPEAGEGGSRRASGFSDMKKMVVLR